MKRIQKRKIKTHQAHMTCDVEHMMVKSKVLSNPPNPLQILGSSAGFKNQFSSINTPNSKPQAAQNYKIIIFIRKVELAFASKDFPKQLCGIHIEGMFFQSFSRFSCI